MHSVGFISITTTTIYILQYSGNMELIEKKSNYPLTNIL